MNNAEALGRMKVACRKTKDLIRDFILSGIMYDGTRDSQKRIQLAMVRGWMMDELEKRDPDAWESWLDSNLDDDGLLQYFHC